MSDSADELIRVAVSGARGKMGGEVVRAVTAAPDMTIVAEIDEGDDLAAVLSANRPDVLVDFTMPSAVMGNVRTALAARVIPLIGTTGLTEADRAEIAALCADARIPALVAPNFALGAILLMRFAAEAAKYMPDVEIIEMHHENKLDAPSGTAALTAELIAASRAASGLTPKGDRDGSFESAPGARGGKVDGIPVHSLRLSGYVASQEVIFGATGQRLSLRHDSTDRTSFMPGVLLAIRQIRSRTGLLVGLETLL